MTKSQRKKFIEKTFSGTEVGVLVERFEDQVKAIGEQHGNIIKKINKLDNKFDDFVIETRNNFKLAMDYLSRIENDFLDLRKKIDHLDRTKVSAKDFDWLKNKVLDIEKQLENYKEQQTTLAAKL